MIFGFCLPTRLLTLLSAVALWNFNWIFAFYYAYLAAKGRARRNEIERARGRRRGVPQLHRQTLQLSITLTVESGDALLPAAACSTHTPRWPVKERHPVHSLAELTDNYFSALVRCRPRCELYSVMHMDVDVNVNVHVDIFRGHSSVHSLIHFTTYSIFYAALRRFCGRRAKEQKAAVGSEFSAAASSLLPNNLYALIPGWRVQHKNNICMAFLMQF